MNEVQYDAASAARPHLLLLFRLQSAARFQEPLKTLGRLGARLSLIGFTHYSYLARRGGHYSYLARRGGPSFATRLLKSASCRGSTNVVR